MPTYLAPGVYFEPIDRSSSVIAPARTDIAAFLGITQKGPAHTPTAVESWAQFQSVFGGFLPNGYLAYCAKAFFENGGQRLYVVRIVAPLVSTVTSAAPQPVDRVSSLVSSVDGFIAGAVVTATQLATAHTSGAQPADRSSSLVDTVDGLPQFALVRISQTAPAPVQAWRRVTLIDSAAKRLTWDAPIDASFSLVNPILFECSHAQDLLLNQVNSVTRTLTWAAPLDTAFNLALPIDFSSGAAPASGSLYDSAGNVTLNIEAISPGSWGNKLTVAVSQSSLAATATSSAPQPVSGTASFVQSVTGFPPGSLVRIYQFDTPAPIIRYRLVQSVDATVNLLVWDTPLIPAFNLTRQISFETVEFSLGVLLSDEIVEVFSGLSMVPEHPRYAPATVASQYVSVQDAGSPAALFDRLPDPQAPQLVDRQLALQSGRDGIAAITASSFIGDPGSSVLRGLRTLEQVDEVAIVAAADALIPPTPATVLAPPPAKPFPCCPANATPTVTPIAPPLLVEAAPVFSLDDVFHIQRALVEHCQALQFRFAILDAPLSGSPLLHTHLSEVQSWRQRFDSSYAALYLPWVLVRDPLLLNHQIVRRIPPSGHVAGVYANTDLTVGVHKAPANVALLWAQDLTSSITAEQQEGLNPVGICCLRGFPGRGLRVYGARTVSSMPAWRYVNVRRLVSMVEHSLYLSLQWAVFEPNDVLLWQKVRIAANSFLQLLWQKGALAGNTADEAFYVRCDLTTNPAPVTANGQMIVEIGIAPVIPAEFVVFRIGRTEDVLEVTES